MAQTFNTQLSAGSGIGRREVHGSRHLHLDVVEDEHVSSSFLLLLNILPTNKTNGDACPSGWMLDVKDRLKEEPTHS